MAFCGKCGDKKPCACAGPEPESVAPGGAAGPKPAAKKRKDRRPAAQDAPPTAVSAAGGQGHPQDPPAAAAGPAANACRGCRVAFSDKASLGKHMQKCCQKATPNGSSVPSPGQDQPQVPAVAAAGPAANACHGCGVAFNDKASLGKHMQKCCQKVTPNGSFVPSPGQDQLQVPAVAAAGPATNACHGCGVVFNDKASLGKHMQKCCQKVTPNGSFVPSPGQDQLQVPAVAAAGPATNACHGCGVVFNDKASLGKHMQKCCQKATPNGSSAPSPGQDQRQVPPEQAQPGPALNACYKCGVAFGDKAALSVHIRECSVATRGPGQRQVLYVQTFGACCNCGAAFGDKAALDAHLQVCYQQASALSVAGQEAPPVQAAVGSASHACYICGVVFGDKATLDVHVQVCYQQASTPSVALQGQVAPPVQAAAGGASHACHLCGVVFGDKAALDAHVQGCYQQASAPSVALPEQGAPSAQAATGSASNACYICGVIFGDKTTLDAHVQGCYRQASAPSVALRGQEAPPVQAAAGSAPNACYICGVIFGDKTMLGVHIQECYQQASVRQPGIPHPMDVVMEGYTMFMNQRQMTPSAVHAPNMRHGSVQPQHACPPWGYAGPYHAAPPAFVGGGISAARALQQQHHHQQHHHQQHQQQPYPVMPHAFPMIPPYMPPHPYYYPPAFSPPQPGPSQYDDVHRLAKEIEALRKEKEIEREHRLARSSARDGEARPAAPPTRDDGTLRLEQQALKEQLQQLSQVIAQQTAEKDGLRHRFESQLARQQQQIHEQQEALARNALHHQHHHHHHHHHPEPNLTRQQQQQQEALSRNAVQQQIHDQQQEALARNAQHHHPAPQDTGSRKAAQHRHPEPQATRQQQQTRDTQPEAPTRNAWHRRTPPQPEPCPPERRAHRFHHTQPPNEPTLAPTPSTSHPSPRPDAQGTPSVSGPQAKDNAPPLGPRGCSPDLFPSVPELAEGYSTGDGKLECSVCRRAFGKKAFQVHRQSCGVVRPAEKLFAEEQTPEQAAAEAERERMAHAKRQLEEEQRWTQFMITYPRPVLQEAPLLAHERARTGGKGPRDQAECSRCGARLPLAALDKHEQTCAGPKTRVTCSQCEGQFPPAAIDRHEQACRGKAR
ncbi:hypothetical protein DIPPA_22542 [Diplonema papillatum]|nr:hypothetical protein DIPPA_22542 [Diplonema papillatum]